MRLSNERAAAAADGATQTVASIAVAESITDAAASSDVIDGVGEGAAASPRVDRAAGGDAPSSAARMAAAKTGRLSVGAQVMKKIFIERGRESSAPESVRVGFDVGFVHKRTLPAQASRASLCRPIESAKREAVPQTRRC